MKLFVGLGDELNAALETSIEIFYHRSMLWKILANIFIFQRVASLLQSWILFAKKNMILASHWSIFFIIILAILNDIEGGQLRDELCCEGAWVPDYQEHVDVGVH